MESSAETFALTPAELSALLNASVLEDISEGEGRSAVEEDIGSYIDLLKELAEPLKFIDFMSVLSAVMLLSDRQIETKIEYIFKYTALGSGHNCFSSEDFLIALRSFESGLSNIMGKRASSEAFVKDTAKVYTVNDCFNQYINFM